MDARGSLFHSQKYQIIKQHNKKDKKNKNKEDKKGGDNETNIIDVENNKNETVYFLKIGMNREEDLHIEISENKISDIQNIMKKLQDNLEDIKNIYSQFKNIPDKQKQVHYNITIV